MGMDNTSAAVCLLPALPAPSIAMAVSPSHRNNPDVQWIEFKRDTCSHHKPLPTPANTPATPPSLHSISLAADDHVCPIPNNIPNQQ
mmetsp:Transcript_6304/g.17134  ORF Transcript_6304/g.17134 Transcript_6304/m.17134 type:complete len:87 (-) Transcript_6304:245-505(-)